MPKIEVEEADFLQNQRVVQTVQAMLNNPDARKLVLKAQKITNPNVVLPSDYQDEVRTELGKVIEEQSKKIDALTTQIAEDKATRETKERTDAFTSKWEADKRRMMDEGVFAETIAAIEKFAHESGIPDFEAATLKYLRAHPQPAPVEPGNLRSFSFFEPPAGDAGAEIKMLLDTRGESENALNALIGKALTDVRSGPQTGRRAAAPHRRE